MVVARADLDPGVGDADERLGEVIVFQTGGAEHGAGAGAVGAPDKSLAAEFGKWITHFAFLSRPFRQRRREKPCHSKSRPPRKAAATKTKGHHPDLDDGPNFSEVRLRHHPLLPLGTTTLRIRTTPGIVQTCKQTGAVRCCVVMALRVIKVAHTIRCGRLHVPPCKVAE